MVFLEFYRVGAFSFSNVLKNLSRINADACLKEQKLQEKKFRKEQKKTGISIHDLVEERHSGSEIFASIDASSMQVKVYSIIMLFI